MSKNGKNCFTRKCQEDTGQVPVGIPGKKWIIKGEREGICSPFVSPASSRIQDVNEGSHGVRDSWTRPRADIIVSGRSDCTGDRRIVLGGKEQSLRTVKTLCGGGGEDRVREENTFAEIISRWCSLIGTWDTLSYEPPKVTWRGSFLQDTWASLDQAALVPIFSQISHLPLVVDCKHSFLLLSPYNVRWLRGRVNFLPL